MDNNCKKNYKNVFKVPKTVYIWTINGNYKMKTRVILDLLEEKLHWTSKKAPEKYLIETVTSTSEEKSLSMIH